MSDARKSNRSKRHAQPAKRPLVVTFTGSAKEIAAAEAAADQYRKLCVRVLKEIDQAHTTTRPYNPHPPTALEELLDYIPALVEDGDLTKAEGKRIAEKIKMIIQEYNIVQPVMKRIAGI